MSWLPGSGVQGRPGSRMDIGFQSIDQIGDLSFSGNPAATNVTCSQTSATR